VALAGHRESPQEHKRQETSFEKSGKLAAPGKRSRVLGLGGSAVHENRSGLARGDCGERESVCVTEKPVSQGRWMVPMDVAVAWHWLLPGCQCKLLLSLRLQTKMICLASFLPSFRRQRSQLGWQRATLCRPAGVQLKRFYRESGVLAVGWSWKPVGAARFWLAAAALRGPRSMALARRGLGQSERLGRARTARASCS